MKDGLKQAVCKRCEIELAVAYVNNKPVHYCKLCNYRFPTGKNS